jgi:hypothetical protein
MLLPQLLYFFLSIYMEITGYQNCNNMVSLIVIQVIIRKSQLYFEAMWVRINGLDKFKLKGVLLML